MTHKWPLTSPMFVSQVKSDPRIVMSRPSRRSTIEIRVSDNFSRTWTKMPMTHGKRPPDGLWSNPGGGYSTLSWVRMCGPKFRTPPYNKTREDANLLPILKPFVSLRAPFKTNQCFLQCRLGCISTFWQPVDKPKDKFIGNYAFCKNAIYIKTNFQIKKGPLQNLRARKSTLSGPHIPVPTFPLSTPPDPTLLLLGTRNST